MGLLKSVETNFGINASYWHIIETHVFWKTMRAEVILAGYFDEKSRRDGKDYLSTKKFNIDITPFADTKIDNVLQIASIVYTIVKSQMPEFFDSENVIEDGQSIASL